MPNVTPTRSAGPTNCVALDLGETAIRVVEMELSGSGDGTRVLRKGSAPLPPHVWHDLASNKDAFAAALRAAISNAGIAGRSVVACLPRRLVTVRFARLPAAPPDQMKAMVNFEAQQYILFSLDEVVLDYHTLTGPLPGFGVTEADDMETVLLVAARRSLVNDLLSIFDKSGLELRQLSASALALAEHARDVLEPTALIDIQPGSMDVAVVSDGKLLFTRATALELEGLAPEVAQRKLDEEVARSFTAYQNEFRNKVLAHVFLSGSSATLRDAAQLERSLGGILEMQVSRLHSRLLPAADPEIIGFATAIGMALQTQPNGLVPISLVPDERAERKARQSRRIKQNVSFAGATAVLLLAAWQAHAMLDRQHQLSAGTIAANNTLKQSKTTLSTVQKQHDKLASFDNELIKGLDRNHNTVDIVVALHSALPPTPNLWLTQLSYTRGGVITMRGESKTATAPTDLVIALQNCGAFRDVKLGYIGDAQETAMVAAPTAPAAAPAAGATTTPLPGFGAPGNTPAFTFPGQGGPGGSQPGQGGFQPGGGGFQPGGGGFQPGGGGFQPGGGGFQPGTGGFRPGRAGGFQPGQTPTTGPQGGTPITIQPDGSSQQILIVPTPPDSGGGAQPPQVNNRSATPQNGPARTGTDAAPPAGKIIIKPDPSAAPPKTKQRANRSRTAPETQNATFSAPSSFRVARSTNALPNPAVTAPGRASSIPAGKPAPVVKAPANNKVTRTSFIITCKVNQNSTDLLSGIDLTSPKAIPAVGASVKSKKHVVGDDTSDDTGDSSDAN